MNVGRARVQVLFMDRSPFSAMPRQEAYTYFTTDSYKTLKQVHAFPTPDPLNGLRIMEVFNPYNNFLEDREKNPLETSYLEQQSKVYDEGEGQQETVTSRSQADSNATYRYKTMFVKTPAQAEGETPQEAQVPVDTNDPLEKEFFTFQCCDNLFVQGDKNPPPPLFTKPPLPSQPSWTYNLMPVPGADKPIILMPFMDSRPESNTNPVHWGCRSKTALAQNQPFEVIWYTCTRDPTPAKDAQPLETRLNYYDGEQLLDLKLTSAIYVAIEVGIGSGEDNYLFLFKNNEEPYLFKMVGNNKERRAQLLARFTGFNSAKLFDRNVRYFTLSVEPVIGSFIVRSNAFGDTPWIILAPVNDPLILGLGNLGIYSGNTSAGFAMRPLQYYPNATFETPGYEFDILYRNGEAMMQPTVSPTMKGDGEIEQDKAHKEPTSDGKQESTLYMVDAEKVNGEAITKVAEAQAERETEDASTTREVKVSVEEVKDDEKPPKTPDAYRVSTKNFKVVGELKASDVEQGNGYKVTNGRSAYLFMCRMEVPGDEGVNPEPALDVSCDVMSVDLNWNATSYYELAHNGTIKVLNNLNNGIDYKQFSNRATYVKVAGYWDLDGAGAEYGKNDEDHWLFEGIIVGFSESIEAHRKVVTFKVEDYMNAMQGVKFALCPPYDGMAASLAIRDIVRNSGLPDKRIVQDGTMIKDANLKNDFGLPITNPFTEPQFLFKNGSSLKEAIVKIAQLDGGKSVFFDQYGKFHYDSIPGGLFANRSFKPKADFYTSPLQSYKGNFTPFNQAFNMVSYDRLINDVYNQIRLRTVTKRSQNQLAVGNTYRAGIFDPNAEGYLGYKKSLFVDEAALGSVDALFRYLYALRARVFIPPFTTRFETYGRPGLKPLDVITLDGQFFRIMNLSMHLSSTENQFWMNVEGEWQFSSAAKDASPDVSPPPPSEGPST